MAICHRFFWQTARNRSLSIVCSFRSVALPYDRENSLERTGIAMNIQTNIKRYMKETGRTQSYLCRRTGLSATTMSLALGNKRRLRLDEYCAICEALDVKPDFFLEAQEAPLRL